MPLQRQSRRERHAYRVAREKAIRDLFDGLGLPPPRIRHTHDFPLNILERSVKALLILLERGVAWLVRRVIRVRA
jgi:hypothetical protein